MEEYGFDIIPRVIESHLLTNAKNGIDNWLRDYCGVDMDNIVAGVKPNNWPMNKHGIIQNFGVSHLQPLWDIRQNTNLIRNVIDLYESNGINCGARNKAGECEDMIVSFDGICVMYPYSDASIKMMKCHKHLDQGLKNYNNYVFDDCFSFQCIQGFVPLIDMEENQGTLEIIKGSHKYYEDVIKRIGDKWKLEQEDIEFLEDKGCSIIRINADAGSYVCWDSRTVHSAQIHNKKVKKEDRKWRYVNYICYQPRYFASPATLKRRIKYFEDLRMTGHMAANPELFPKFPRTYGKEIDVRYYDVKPVLNVLGKRLVGY